MEEKKKIETKPKSYLSRRERREAFKEKIKSRKEMKKNRLNQCKERIEQKIEIIDGMRWVVPYVYWFEVIVKERWIGKEVKEIMKEEFHYLDDDITKAFEKRLLKVQRNNKEINENCIFEQGDILLNQIHRHELPVPCLLPIIHEDNDVIVVNKPSGIPTHSGGRYTENTVINILEKERNIKLFGVHRLDRLTSGVLIIAKSSEIANEIQRHFISAHKKYICRVIGYMGSCIVNKPIIETTCITKQRVTVGSEGKISTTIFEQIQYDQKTDTTLLWAIPKTGRMHQIRVHLSYENHPIANDSMYRNKNEYCIHFSIPENWKQPGCKECISGIEIPQENLWLSCIELSVEYHGTIKTFISEIPKWGTKNYDCSKDLQEWRMVHNQTLSEVN
ncbi:ribosomal pseudouridine synthase, putative [Entamoeba dispar SAW760]|uniref:Ribosomal pseudouridine synthase, putative n=1 Tax=Entamoeba dispar (strain ATCC PRA-260 / SAW760) TaxID=370354 RepID=B0EHA4_ENTDS|nr:ribosomal pseudouridine synthase, putative [Entamoeba dispar SAW760]EDR26097.1 ribosomal pseudouridine synthase, putative [Entamoeba dispar SAW760]|eukprot:EDR26097.1 ribosomal pseudouridine synthase, putative [Entamoeba dispar SAW760]